MNKVMVGASRFKPTSKDIIGAIKATKKLNKKHSNVVVYVSIGLVFATIMLVGLGTTSSVNLLSFNVSGWELAIFGIIYSIASWVADSLGLLKLK